MPASSSAPVHCQVCEAEYPVEPAFAVPCPVCGADAGTPCIVRRPSGHRPSLAFSAMPPWGHDERELRACAAGAYSKCGPDCGLSAEQAHERLAEWLKTGGRVLVSVGADSSETDAQSHAEVGFLPGLEGVR